MFIELISVICDLMFNPSFHTVFLPEHSLNLNRCNWNEESYRNVVFKLNDQILFIKLKAYISIQDLFVLYLSICWCKKGN